MHLLYREFLEEMRSEFSRHEMASESLTRKATNLMMIAGIISTLLLGLYTLLLEHEKNIFSDWVHGIWVGVILLIITVVACVVLNKVETQKTLFVGKKFLDKSGNIDLKILNSWIDADEKYYYERLHEEYIKCLVHAEDVNETKSRWYTISITLFLIGLISVPILLGLSILL